MQNRQFYRGVTFIQVDEPATPTVGDTWLGTESGECVQIYTGSGPDQGWKKFGGSCPEIVNIDFLLPADYDQQDDTKTVVDGQVGIIPIIGDTMADGVISSYLSSAHGVFILDNYAYVTSYSNHSLTIFDISDKKTITFVGQIGDEVYLKGAYGIEVVGNYAYVSPASSSDLIIIDVSDKSNPNMIGHVTVGNWCHDLVISGNYVYVTGYKSSSLAIVDISIKTAPTLISTLSITTAYDVEIIDETYIGVTSINDNSLIIIDVSNKNDPTIVGSVSDSTYMLAAHGLRISGNYAYVVGHDSMSLCIVDITDKSAPFVVGGIIDNPNLELAFDVDISGNYVYVSGFTNKIISVIDITDKSAPFIVDYIRNLNVIGSPHTVFVNDDCLHVASYPNGYAIIDISDPLNLPRDPPTYELLVQPYYITTKTNSQIDLTNNNLIKTCEIIHDEPADTTIKCLVSFNNKTSWMKYNTTNSVWEPHSNGLTNLQTGNTISEIILGLTDLDVSNYSTLDFAFDLNTTVTTATPSIDEINISLY